MQEFMAGLIAGAMNSPWSEYRPANTRGTGLIPGYVLAPHANTGGQDAAGSLPTPPGGTTTALDTVGVVYDGTPNTQFDKVVTALVVRNVMENLRTKTIVMQEGAWLRAKHVPGTKTFRYTAFADLGAAEDLLEGVPPQTEGLVWDTFEFTGAQKGKLVAITDLAELFNPFDLYRVAAEKVAWNAIDTAEGQAVALMSGAEVGLGDQIVVVDDAPAANIIATVVAMKKAEVPPFPDGKYRALISPADAAFVMTETGELGWTETGKYQAGQMVLNGELGTFRGIRFIESNRVTDHKTIVFGPGAWVWGDYQTIQAYRVAPGGDHADPLAQRGLVGWKGMWGMSLTAFDGSPAFGPATNPEAFRFAQVDLTGTV
jgi:N4-gp56 family major capsid protein